MARACSSPMVATSARAWPTRTVGAVERPRGGPEQVQRADDLIAQPHRQGLHRGEPGAAGGGREPRPAPGFGGQVSRGDGLAGLKAVQARTLVVLQLEQLQQPDGFAGGGHHPQRPARVGQQQPGGGDVQQLPLRSVSTCRKSITSKSATMVSVSSTNVADSSSPSIPPHHLRCTTIRPGPGPGIRAGGGQDRPHAAPSWDGSGSRRRRRRRATISRATSSSGRSVA